MGVRYDRLQNECIPNWLHHPGRDSFLNAMGNLEQKDALHFMAVRYRLAADLRGNHPNAAKNRASDSSEGEFPGPDVFAADKAVA